MKLTIDNYFDRFDQYLDIINAEVDMLAAHNFVLKVTKSGKDFTNYNASEDIKETVDLYLQALERLKARNEKPASKKTVKRTASKKEAPAKRGRNIGTSNPAVVSKVIQKAKAVPETVAEQVELIPSDVALVKRYISLHDKTKTQEQVLAVWRAFNKAIVERKVIKDSPYKNEVTAMNSSLKSALEQAQSVGSLHLVIPAAKLKTYKTIAESVARSAGVALLLEFINISGKAGMQQRADKLCRRIEKAIGSGKLKGDRYSKEISKAKTELDAYLNKETDSINLNAYGLSGISEIAVFGCVCEQELSGFTRSQNAVVYKLVQERVKNLHPCELDRAFSDTVAPNLCKTIAQKLITAGVLTMSLIRNPAKVPGGSLNGSDSSALYDFGTEVMDLRLRNAGKQSPVHTKAMMQGLSGTTIPAAPAVPVNAVKIVSARDLVKQEFKTIGLQGKYRELIGDPEPGFSAIIYGKPFQGKSTLAIDFAKELTALGKVLYVAHEEGHGGTLKDKILRNKADVLHLDFADKLPADLSAYRYVFMDSVTDAKLSEGDFNALIKVNKQHGTSIIGVLHATKAGQFRGGQTFAHDADVMIRVEDGIAYSRGRFAPPGQIGIDAILSLQQGKAAA